ncbi:MAG: chromosomal replication initiator protein DnaA [Moraxellaceae bacterium]|nr:chromosomal replication initiator protein DnaA [Pseudobdellovibrionaceae bacterium]
MQIDSSFWSDFKSTMKIKSGPNKLLENYLDPIDFVKFDKDEQNVTLTLGVPNRFFYFYANENLKDKIDLELKTAYPDQEINIQFIITEKVNQDYNLSLQNILQNSEQIFQNLPAIQKTVFPIERGQSNENINTDLTFSTFVVGKNSEFAHAATYNVAQNPGIEDYNPLFIYGPSGMGKTHLLNAAANHIKENFPHYRITYISAERFLNECVAALRRHEMDKFRQKYRENTDILVVDDVQYIGRGQAVQEEFFHMINMLIEKKKQIILASDRMPKDIGLEDRARTRLERGLIADIIMPDLETRIAILRYKAEKTQIKIPEDALQYIARISKKSIRELEGNLKKIKMFSELQGLSINLDLCKKVLAHHESTVTISIEEIQRIVSEFYKIRITDIKSSSRAKPIVVPRQIAMYLIKKFLDKSLVEIGKSFGGKDHTTVINSLNKIEGLLQKDPQFKNDIDDLITQIHNVTGV